MPLPDFLGVGVQRAGTTFVNRALSEHPEVCTPDDKELHFFDWHWDRGEEWYKDQFAACEPGQVVGEVTPDYIADEAAVRRMAVTVPDAKLFVLLRDPVERAYSAYWLFREDRYPDRSFEEAIEDDSDLLERGRYADQLARLEEHFDPDQIHVAFLADMKEDDVALVQDLYRFLGVDPTYEPDTAGESHNALVFPRLQAALRRLRLLWLKDLAKALGLDGPVRRWHRGREGSSYPPMDPDTRERLRERFRPHDEALRDHLGRPIPWRPATEPRAPEPRSE